MFKLSVSSLKQKLIGEIVRFKTIPAMVIVAQLVGVLSHRARGHGFNSSQGNTQVAGSIPDWGTYKRQRIIVSLSDQCLSLSLSLSQINKNISSGED